MNWILAISAILIASTAQAGTSGRVEITGEVIGIDSNSVTLLDRAQRKHRVPRKALSTEPKMGSQMTATFYPEREGCESLEKPLFFGRKDSHRLLIAESSCDVKLANAAGLLRVDLVNYGSMENGAPIPAQALKKCGMPKPDPVCVNKLFGVNE